MQRKLFSEAEKLRKTSRYPEAIRLYRKALVLSRRGGDRVTERDSLLSLGDTCRMVGRFDHAIRAYEAALPACKELKDHLSCADAYTGIGLCKRALADWRLSISFFKKAEIIYRRMEDCRGIAFIHWARGGTYRVAGKVHEAMIELTAARAAYVCMGSDPDSISGQGYSLCSLGGLSRVAGKYRDSLAYYQKAHALLSSQKDRFGTAYSFCGIGNAYRMLGDFRTSCRFLKKAEKLYQTLGDIVSYSYTLWSMGMLSLMEGDLSTAGNYFAKAGNNFRKTKDVRGIVYSNLGKAQVLIQKGRPLSARKIIDVAGADAKRYSLALESCHATTLLAYLVKRKSSGACYRRAGSGISFKKFPLNIP